MTIDELKEHGVETEPKNCRKCPGEVHLTPKPLNPLIGTCQECKTTYAWLNLEKNE